MERKRFTGLVRPEMLYNHRESRRQASGMQVVCRQSATSRCEVWVGNFQGKGELCQACIEGWLSGNLLGYRKATGDWREAFGQEAFRCCLGEMPSGIGTGRGHLLLVALQV